MLTRVHPIQLNQLKVINIRKHFSGRYTASGVHFVFRVLEQAVPVPKHPHPRLNSQADKLLPCFHFYN